MPGESANIVVQAQPNAGQNKVVRFQDGVLPLKEVSPLLMVTFPYAYFTAPAAILMLKGIGVMLCNPSG